MSKKPKKTINYWEKLEKLKQEEMNELDPEILAVSIMLLQGLVAKRFNLKGSPFPDEYDKEIRELEERLKKLLKK